jgi:hypothetical protein
MEMVTELLTDESKVIKEGGGGKLSTQGDKVSVLITLPLLSDITVNIVLHRQEA